MNKNEVREFVDKYFAEFLEIISEHTFMDLVVDGIEEFDSLFGRNSFKENLYMVIKNEIDVNDDCYLCWVNGEWYGYPSSRNRIRITYTDIITEQLLNKKCTEWDEAAEYADFGDDDIDLKKIRKGVLNTMKFRVNLMAILEGIDVEAENYGEAYKKAIDMLSKMAKDMPIKSIVKNISGADVYDNCGHFKGGISNCMDELK